MIAQTKTTWRKVKLGELADINSRLIGTGFPYREIEYIDISSVGTGELLGVTKYKLKEAPGRARRLLFNGDTILSTVRPNRRSFLFIKKAKENTVASTGFAVLSPKKGVDPRFLYYFISRQQFTNYLEANVKGSAYPAVSSEAIGDAEISVPSFENQKRITDVLSAFDDKIELNNKISRTLEEMAQAIFKEWLVKFRFPGHEKAEFVESELGKIPKGWQVRELGAIADVQWGDTSVTKASYVSEGYPAYSASGQDGFRKTYDFDRTGIVLSAIGANCGITWLARNKWSVIKNTIRFWSTDKRVSTEYLFLATMRQESWPQRGSAQPFITMGEARKRKILIPTESILNQFNNFVVGAYAKIEDVRLENQKLAALRDLLLPKLMSGEIKANSHPFALEDLSTYLHILHQKTQDSRLVDLNVKARIIDQITEAIGITNLSFSDLLQRLDFKSDDLTIEALESFLAELRAIFWLRDFGFSNIVPLEAKKNIKQPDFMAKYKNKTCAIEVFCITQKHEQQKGSNGVYVNFDPQFIGSKFGRDFISVARTKKQQLDASDANIKVLLCVVNPTPMTALSTKDDFDSHLELLFKELNWGRNYHLGILTGAHANGVPSDTIFPKFE